MSAPWMPARRHFLRHGARFALLAAAPTLAIAAEADALADSGAGSSLPAGGATGLASESVGADSAPLPGASAAAPSAEPAPASASASASAPESTVTPESAPASPSAGGAVAQQVHNRTLALFHTHTGERIDLMYASGERYLPEALNALNRFLRDHYTGDIGLMDPQVFDMLHRVRELLGGSGCFEVISGYRCPATNDHLRQTRGGGVAKKSLHMEGRAIDVRLSGVPLAELHAAALSLQAGGVGYYPDDQFIHLDTGRVRNW